MERVNWRRDSPGLRISSQPRTSPNLELGGSILIITELTFGLLPPLTSPPTQVPPGNGHDNARLHLSKCIMNPELA